MLPTIILSAVLLASSALSAAISPVPVAAISHVTPLSKRGFAGIGITIYTGFNCGGNSATIGNVLYGQQNIAPQNPSYQSFGVSRAVRNDEQLDFSTFGNGDACGRFLVTYRQLNQGCYNLGGINCFRLLQN